MNKNNVYIDYPPAKKLDSNKWASILFKKNPVLVHFAEFI